MHLPSITVLIFLFFLATPNHSFPSVDSDDGPRSIEQWCARTPHLAACSHAFIEYPSVVVSHPEFYALSVEAAHSEAIRALSHLETSRPASLTGPEDHAWSDCVRLYANTRLQLNRTQGGTLRTSFYDSQTWLSAALTNLEMCRTGFSSVKASLDIIAHVERYNVSELISNCLAVNGPFTREDPSRNQTSKGYPKWVRSGVRRELTAAEADIVVAADGTGQHKTIGEAVTVVARMARTARVVIYVKRGIYRENIQIPSDLTGLTLAGEGMGRTVITGRRSAADGYTLITSATLAVFGDGFLARDLTIRNTYGSGSQAVALLLASDQSVIYRCRIDGYQDTLCTFSQRQFYRECQIFGTVDFIFGNAAAVLQNCTIFPRRPLKGQSDPITAQGRSDANQNTGIVIHRSTIRPHPDLLPVRSSVKVYLGRPWKEYSRTVVMQSYLSSIVDPKGWLEWDGDFALSTLYYAEFKNTGAGSRMSRRVKWPGYHVIVKPSLVKRFTVSEFVAGGMWLPATGIPFTAGF